MIRRVRLVLIAVALATIAALALGACGDDSDDAGGEVVGGAEVTQALSGIPQDGERLGPPDAPVKITEYADLQCPFCKQAAEELNPQLIEQFVKPGTASIDLRVVGFIGDDSETGALAALAAGEQDALWNFTDVVFRNQGGENDGWLNDEFMTEAATAAGLDLAAWEAAKQDQAVADRFFELSSLAQQDGVEGTPFYVIEGPGGRRTVNGVGAIEEFTSAIAEVS